MTKSFWHSGSGSLVYKAQSQDEDALVQAAARLQMMLCTRKGSFVGGLFILPCHQSAFFCSMLLFCRCDVLLLANFKVYGTVFCPSSKLDWILESC